MTYEFRNYTLTTGVDTITGTAGNDTINSLLGTGATLTANDLIDGGAGTDTLSVRSDGAATIPAITTSNVEKFVISAAGAVTSDTSSTTSFPGVTSVSSSGVGAATITAAAGTDLTVATSALVGAAVAVNGGKNVSVTATGSDVNGGASTIAVGGTTAAAGTVTVKATTATADLKTAEAIAVTGGTVVSVEQVAGNAVNTTTTAGAVTVTGNANTTTVTVKDSAAATAATAVVGHVNGAVDVLDVNRADNTKAGTITTVTLDSFAAATVNSGALTTLNLKGTGTSVNAGTLGALTTPANTALALNVNGLTTTGTVTIDSDIKTLNLASTTAASTINLLTSTGVTALNISGDAKVTLTGQTAVANQVITVTNTAGAVLGTELDTGAKFTGGSGADSVLIAGATKVIDMGAGNDVVTVSTTTLGTGGAVKGGDGTDTLVANTNGSAFSSLPGFTGFETLRVAGTAAEGAHNAVGFTALELGSTKAAVSSFTSVAAGVGLTVLAAPGGAHTVTLADATGKSDSFNLTFKSAAALDLSTNGITLAGVETINITNTDTNTTAQTNKLNLTADSVTSIVATGNAGLDMTGSTYAKVTNFDASGISGAAADAATLAVTYVSGNTTVGENVTIKGGSGNDSLTGNAANNDTILGGDGADTLVYTGGTDTFTGGAGKDTFDINGVGTSTSYLTVTDAAVGDKLDFVGISTGTIANATLGAKVTLGAAATLAQYFDAAAAGNGGANALVKWFQFGSDTYVVVDNDAGGTFASGTDLVVKLAGTIDLSTSALASEVLTLA